MKSNGTNIKAGQLEKGLEHLRREIAWLEGLKDRHRSAEDALQESEERFHLMVELLPFPISIFDSEGKYLYTNRKFTEVFGYTLEDIPTGKRWFELAFPDPAYRSEALHAWKSDLAELQKGDAKSRLFRVQRKDGAFRDIIFR